MNRLKHIFCNCYGEPLDKKDGILSSDKCKICNLFLDQNYYTGNDDDLYKNIINKLSKLYPCLTEEEYIIKKLLE